MPPSASLPVGDGPGAPPPTRGAPRWLRWGVAGFVALLAAGNRFGRWLLRSEYRVTGACRQRGACCHHVLLEWRDRFDRHPWLGRVVLWKLTRFYRFFDRGYTLELPNGQLARVLGCHALGADGRCTDHPVRPFFCRTYPEVPLWGRPGLHPGCGYQLERRFPGVPEADPSLVRIGGGPPLAPIPASGAQAPAEAPREPVDGPGAPS